ncbi:hypothetical protein CH35J_012864 [Colletotrichum higginsianum]|uniref:Uncharacterized protein n=1 Tax=Colletotrichum higginsianum TaxID=80884 RepID=A0A4T0VC65_9PEZI|nr:hypothetical protein CH35J_012864 [Colletotrichum higginsianum]
MDRLKIQFDNANDAPRQGDVAVPTVQKRGHPSMLLSPLEKAIAAGNHMSEVEPRRLRRRFGHPSVYRLRKLPHKAGQKVHLDAIARWTKYCQHCQLHGQSPHRPRFAIQDVEGYAFHHEIVVDVMYLEGSRPVLDVVDSATAFHAARLPKATSAKSTWAGAGRNFTAAEFRHEAEAMSIDVEIVPAENHDSVGKVGRYHAAVRRAYEIIQEECPTLPRDSAVQGAIKSVSDTAGPDGLVPTLVVFGAYPRMADGSPPSPDITPRVEAIRKASAAVGKIHAKRQVNDALATHHGPDTAALKRSRPVGPQVRVWRETKGWTGPYRLVDVDGETCVIDVNGPPNFRSTVIKPYHQEDSSDNAEINEGTQVTAEDLRRFEDSTVVVEIPPQRGESFESSIAFVTGVQMTFLSKKEAADRALALKLRNEGVTTTPGAPFEESNRKEVDNLIDRGGYANDGKVAIRTQSPTIQQSSQRFLLALASSILTIKGSTLWICDIAQAYTYSTSKLDRTNLAHLPIQIQDQYPEGTIIEAMKPLYGVAEAGTHWWATYTNHHKKKLQMETTAYNPCLLLATAENPHFGIVGMQTEDTIGLGDSAFDELEDDELKNAALLAKPKGYLSAANPLLFNGGIVSMGNDGRVTPRQKGQGLKLETIDPKSVTAASEYVKQQARGAYIATVCQPEASFNLPTAAEHQQPSLEEMAPLHRRLTWQKRSIDRGPKRIPLDLATATIFVFVDGSLANNADPSSPIGFVILLANKKVDDDSGTFEINANIIHFSSTKSK